MEIFEKYCNQLKCDICDDYSIIVGTCSKHYKDSILINIKDKIFDNLLEEKSNILKLFELYHKLQKIENENKQFIKINIKKLKEENKLFTKQKDISNLIINKDLEKIIQTDFNYNKILKNIDEIIENNKQNKKYINKNNKQYITKIQKINLNELNTKYKNSKNNRKIILNIYDNIKTQNSEKRKKCSFTIFNNDYLIKELLHIFESKILYATTELPINIKNHILRYDIYLILYTKNNDLFECIIETDEKHHYNEEKKIENLYDIYKDIYCITNSISLLRIKTNKLKDNDIEIAKNFINKIIETNYPLYDLGEEYIKIKEKILNNTENKLLNKKEIKQSKIINITFPIKELSDSELETNEENNYIKNFNIEHNTNFTSKKESMNYLFNKLINKN